MRQVTFQPVRVNVPGGDDARLAFVEERLVAVLVRLPPEDGPEAGRWFLEIGFGRLDGVSHPTFAELEAAGAWILDKLDAPVAPADTRSQRRLNKGE